MKIINCRAVCKCKETPNLKMYVNKTVLVFILIATRLYVNFCQCENVMNYKLELTLSVKTKARNEEYKPRFVVLSLQPLSLVLLNRQRFYSYF